MDRSVEYSTEEIARLVGLRPPRTRQLLNDLVSKELLKATAVTKNQRYIKK